MNKDDLIKLRELLKQDKVQIDPNIDLEQGYATYDGDGIGIDEIYTAEEIISKKVSASVVADRLINIYLRKVQAFHYFGLDKLTPVMNLGLAIVCKCTEDMESEFYEDKFVQIPKEERITLGDIVEVFYYGEDTPFYFQAENEIEELAWYDIAEQLDLDEEAYRNYKKTMEKFLDIQTDDLKENTFVSFDELLVELYSRGFYCNFKNFEEFNENINMPSVYISFEPIIQKGKNIK